MQGVVIDCATLARRSIAGGAAARGGACDRFRAPLSDALLLRWEAARARPMRQARLWRRRATRRGEDSAFAPRPMGSRAAPAARGASDGQKEGGDRDDDQEQTDGDPQQANIRLHRSSWLRLTSPAQPPDPCAEGPAASAPAQAGCSRGASRRHGDAVSGCPPYYSICPGEAGGVGSVRRRHEREPAEPGGADRGIGHRRRVRLRGDRFRDGRAPPVGSVGAAPPSH